MMVFNPNKTEIYLSKFPKEDWSETAYGEFKEELPPNAPQERGIGMTTRDFVDSDHSGNTLTRRSRAGFIIFLNNYPIYWFSKKKTIIETSSIGFKFVAMKQLCEYIWGLQYNLRMMGISIYET